MIAKVKFDQDGLVPAIVQDYYTKEVLTLAYMNRQSLEISLKEKRTCFYSRSRKELWRKGETSGNYQDIVSIKADCDLDALIVEVKKDGPACHLGTESCFSQPLYQAQADTFTLGDLYRLIEGRKLDPVEGSYTNYLFEKGLDKILKKIGEEATEVVIAAKNQAKDELSYEIADLVYHGLVLMVDQGLSFGDILEELAGRHQPKSKE